MVPQTRIEVITTASMIPVEVGDNYLNAFGKIGCTDIGVMHIRNRADVSNPEYLERITNCQAVMFSGGNQLRLTAIFGGTAFLDKLLQRYWEEPDFSLQNFSRCNGNEQYHDMKAMQPVHI